MLEKLIEKRNEERSKLDELLKTVETEERTELSDDENAEFDTRSQKIKALDERIAELDELAERDAKIEESRGLLNVKEETVAPTVTEMKEQGVYDNPKRSFLTDAYNAEFNGDYEARERVNYSQKQELESRDVSTSNFAGLVIPQYLVDQTAENLKAGSPFYNSIPKFQLPDDGMTMHISRVTTGTAVGAQSSENGAVSETDIDDTDYTFPVTTYAGAQDVSKQAIDRGTGTEDVLMADLMGAYYTAVDNAMINGDESSGTLKGLKNITGITSTTWTDASPTGAEAVSKFAKLISDFTTARYASPDLIIMHPRRWAYLVGSLDANNRPFVLPQGNNPSNAVGIGSIGYNAVGTLFGIPVVTDANIQTDAGSGNNEDNAFAVKTSDLPFFESANAPFRLRFEATAPKSLQVTVVVFNYVAFGAGKQPKSIGMLSGTGMAGVL
tara:strand:- start:8886 stop:10208 length:1323 start_codon:yes stop_codon:yes gene_type:complete